MVFSTPELSLLLDTLACAERPWVNQQARRRPQLQVTQRGHGSTRYTIVPEGQAWGDWGARSQRQALWAHVGVGDAEPDR